MNIDEIANIVNHIFRSHKMCQTNNEPTAHYFIFSAIPYSFKATVVIISDIKTSDKKETFYSLTNEGDARRKQRMENNSNFKPHLNREYFVRIKF